MITLSLVGRWIWTATLTLGCAWALTYGLAQVYADLALRFP